MGVGPAGGRPFKGARLKGWTVALDKGTQQAREQLLNESGRALKWKGERELAVHTNGGCQRVDMRCDVEVAHCCAFRPSHNQLRSCK